MDLLRPHPLKVGDTIGIFTPSSPAYVFNEELFCRGIKNLENLGYKVKLGRLTKARARQGYRSGSPVDRAWEFMELIEDDSVTALIACIGGANSSSMIPFLDFDAIRAKQKIICGYSDVTSLHLAILHFAGLKTIYGPALMTWFGEYPNGIKGSVESFEKACTWAPAGTVAALQSGTARKTSRDLHPFEKWSNHSRDWENGDWKTLEREWKQNPGWRCLNPGKCSAEIVVANLSTLLSSAGTVYFPDVKGKILLVESMAAPFSEEERNFRQLQLMGVFDSIAGLIVGKPEVADSQGSGFSYADLICEVVGERSYPIVSNFDCGHTLPMHSLGQRSMISLEARDDFDVKFTILDSFVNC